MVSSLAKLKRWLLPAGAALAAVSLAQAQNPLWHGRPILFSSPEGDDAASNAPPPSAQAPVFTGFAGAVQAPTFNFGAAPQIEPLPAPSAPVMSSAGAAELQRQLDEQRNWTMLTPEEILNLPTPEKMLHLPRRDAAGQPKNETVATRYLERQGRQADAGTNGYAADGSPQRWNLSGGQPSQASPAFFAPANGGPGNAMLMNQFLNGAQDNNSAMSGQGPGTGWPKLFGPPAAPAPTPEQLAAAREFQKLLEPRMPQPGGARARPGGAAFPALQTTPGAIPGQPMADPIGAPFAPLKSAISLPPGVATLPALFGQSNTPAAPAAPVWKPQPPPWMSSAPQPGVIPQRKF